MKNYDEKERRVELSNQWSIVSMLSSVNVPSNEETKSSRIGSGQRFTQHDGRPVDWRIKLKCKWKALHAQLEVSHDSAGDSRRPLLTLTGGCRPLA